MSPGSHRLPLRLAVAALVGACLPAIPTAPAHAAFPGRDGKLVYGWSSFSESELEPFPSRTESALRAATGAASRSATPAPRASPGRRAARGSR